MNFCLIWQLSFNSAYNSFFCFPFFLCQINAPSPPPPLMILLILHWKHFFCNVWGWGRAARCHSNSNYSHLQKRLVFFCFFFGQYCLSPRTPNTCVNKQAVQFQVSSVVSWHGALDGEWHGELHELYNTVCARSPHVPPLAHFHSHHRGN